MMALGDKVREVLLMLTSKYDITTDHNIDGIESDCEILVEIHQDNLVTENEIAQFIKPLEDDDYTFHVSATVNHVGILVESRVRDTSIEKDTQFLAN